MQVSAADGDKEMVEEDEDEEMPEIREISNKGKTTFGSGLTEEPQGYRSDDISKLDTTKKTRVLLYLGLALVPVLFLVPFFMSRNFVPPLDPSSML